MEVVTDEYAVVADPGVVTDCVADRGVINPLGLGESSGRADRALSLLLLLLLPDRRRLNDNCLFNGERLDICVGIMRGGRSFGDNGGRVLVETFDSVSLVEALDMKFGCFQPLPGALAERSCSTGRPGIVAS